MPARRSLAKSASLYNKYNTEHSAPYWRSPIWINANFLTLQVRGALLKRDSDPSRPAAMLRCTAQQAALPVHAGTGSAYVRQPNATSSEKTLCAVAAWLQALHHYAGEPGPHAAMAKEVYGKLRANVLDNIVRQYNTTGYLWENYDDETGRGKGSHPFTGCVLHSLLTANDGATSVHGSARPQSAADGGVCSISHFHFKNALVVGRGLLHLRLTPSLCNPAAFVDCRWTALFVLVAGETYD